LQNLNKIVASDNLSHNILKNSQNTDSNSKISSPIEPTKLKTENSFEPNINDDSETKKMLLELSNLKKKNQMYLDKIQKLDTMSDKMKKQKQNDSLINPEYEQNLVNEISKLKPKGMSEQTLLNKIKTEVSQRSKREISNTEKNHVENHLRVVKSSKFSINYTD